MFALLLGSGISRAADIPTGWEITLDLVRRIAKAKGLEDQPDWGAWYQDQTGKSANYSELVQELGLSPDERRSILHSYIEPTEEDREEGRKVPTRAHEAVAKVVSAGYVKLIITTNFDRLIENALRERGVEPTVVASVDALKGAEPIAHSSCYVLKLHGDYKDARIRNTDEELSGYPPELDTLLDRILDEYGLVVAGWSGEWDHALRAAILRTPNRRYPYYWASRAEPASGALELLDHRHAKLIRVKDADSFFGELSQKVEAIERTHRQNPLGMELLISSAKRFLAKPEHRIQLDELVSGEVERLVDHLSDGLLTAQSNWSIDEFNRRIDRYESYSEPLGRLAGVLGRWGEGSESLLMHDVIRSLWTRTTTIENGLTAWLKIRSYPAVLAMTAYGLGLVRAKRWRNLRKLFAAEVNAAQGDHSFRIVDVLLLWAWEGGDNDYWQKKKGLEKRRTPLSDHLCKLFESWGKSFLGLAPDYELLYETFEVLGSLSYIDSVDQSELRARAEDHAQGSWVWMPVGRSGWHSTTRNRILSEVQREPLRSELIDAGFFKGSEEFLSLSITNYNKFAARMAW